MMAVGTKEGEDSKVTPPPPLPPFTQESRAVKAKMATSLTVERNTWKDSHTHTYGEEQEGNRSRRVPSEAVRGDGGGGR